MYQVTRFEVARSCHFKKRENKFNAKREDKPLAISDIHVIKHY